MDGIELNFIYCGPPPDKAEIWLRWNLDPVLLVAVALLAWGLRRSRLGLLAVAALLVAFVSPLCALSAALFSARVVHHVLLVAAAAPLLALAWPGRRAGSPALPFLAATAVLWGWHWPAVYDFALSNVAAYWTMQITLVGSAVLFWQAVLHPAQAPGTGLVWILAAYMQMALLGALLTFAPRALYEIHAVAPLAWGFTPLADQQLGGVVMWVPAGLPFLAWGVLLARRGWRALGERPA